MVSLMPVEPFKTILEAYGMHDFCTGPEGLEPSTSCSAGSHSIQAELWTPRATDNFSIYELPFATQQRLRATPLHKV
jgi:hypothetical protein